MAPRLGNAWNENNALFSEGRMAMLPGLRSMMNGVKEITFAFDITTMPNGVAGSRPAVP